MSVLCFYGHFVASKVGKTSLTPTVDLWRIVRSDGTSSQVVTAGESVEVGNGLVILALGRKDTAPVIVGFRILRVDLYHLVEVNQRLVISALVEIEDSPEIMGLVIPGIYFQGFIEIRQRFVV